ncbi:MAG: hypothetical protein CVV45_01635 [Spirochaetae bacterium HGW-Spirochaetae-10]|nr:MAG: hypothetical protein CVV45_01635 [Spirochaetae bacterium HGW-Spirochaetae-10]
MKDRGLRAVFILSIILFVFNAMLNVGPPIFSTYGYVWIIDFLALDSKGMNVFAVGAMSVFFFGTSTMFYIWVRRLCHDQAISRTQMRLTSYIPIVTIFTAPAMIHSHWPGPLTEIESTILWTSRIAVLIYILLTVASGFIYVIYPELIEYKLEISAAQAVLLFYFYLAQPILVWLSSRQMPRDETDILDTR